MFIANIVCFRRFFRQGLEKLLSVFILFSILLWVNAAKARTVRLCQQLVNESHPEAREPFIRQIFKNRPEGFGFARADIIVGRALPSVPAELRGLVARAGTELVGGQGLAPVLLPEQAELFSQTGLIPRNFDMSERWFRDPNSALTIGKQSRSIIRRDLGLGVVRDYSWLKTETGMADLDRVHVARNYKEDGSPYSLEMLLFDGERWQSYLFMAEGNFWRIVDQIDNKPVREVCMKCHVSKGVGGVPRGRMSPVPFFMREPQSWFRSGFADSDLVDRLLKH